MVRFQKLPYLLLLALLLCAGPLVACPMCNTKTGKEVRTGIAEDFFSTLFSVLAPFAVLPVVIFGVIRTLRIFDERAG